jgi:urease accessory protein
MDALLLLLLDSRAPAGAHAHSGGMEPAVTAGLVHDLDDVEEFCRGRLHTAGRVAAAFAAAACGPDPDWDELDAEYEARLPSEALRHASRQLGGGLRRMLRAMFPAATLPWSYSPHHPIALGHGVALAAGTPDQAAQAAALATVAAPASAAVRLLGLDPLAVHGMLARLACELGEARAVGPARFLPADSAPFLDLLADIHRTAEVRLFAS